MSYTVQGDHASVEMWSQLRLPFEPKNDETFGMRDDLRAALARMKSAPGRVLHAVYAAEHSRQLALGARMLVWNRESGVQWNPADDLLVAAQVTVDCADSRFWLVDARLREAIPA